MSDKLDFSQWFCLGNGRKNFSIDPLEDSRLLFGDTDEEAAIDRRLRRAQLLNVPVRLVWIGPYGMGKTHRLRHTAYLIKANDYKYEAHYVVCGDISEKTGFGRMHYELVNTLDTGVIRGHVDEYMKRIRDGETLPTFEEICGTSSDVAKAFKSLGSGNDNLVGPAWKYLCGLPLKGNEIDLANVTRPVLELTGDFAAVLSALATVIEKQTDRQLFYLIDEAEKINRITNKTAEAAWNEALRAILDIKNLNIIMSAGGEKLDQLPVLLMFPDVVRRIQKENYVQMEPFKAPLATSFVSQLLASLVDGEKLAELQKSDALTSAADFDLECYPFASRKVFERFIDNVVIDPREAKPSVVLDKLNTIAVEALLSGQRLISGDLMTQLGYS